MYLQIQVIKFYSFIIALIKIIIIRFCMASNQKLHYWPKNSKHMHALTWKQTTISRLSQ